IIIVITARKKIETDLAQARDAALGAAKAKSNFLANMSHELRTPLMSITGGAELLLDSSLNEQQKQWVQIMNRGSRALIHVINDVLDVSKIEAGQMEIIQSPFNLHDLAQETIELMRLRAHEKNLKIFLHIAPGVNADVTGDSNRLRQILFNLLGNAIKFTEKGSVVLDIKQESPNGNGETLLFCVKDTGDGIAKAMQEKIFESFLQVNPARDVRRGGAGLGLTISKRLVELMGGRIWVESEEGNGCAFFFKLTLKKQSAIPQSTARATDKPAKPALAENLRPLRILLADDSENNRNLIFDYLVNAACEVNVAGDGQAAVEKFKSGKFDLVLMDMRMPTMDGYAATRLIREWEAARGGAMVPIVALTAFAMSEEIKMSLEAGCTAHLSKPVRKMQLLETIAGLTAGPKT
ncbi:MAG: ATP-binding protein, partial [Elusimicrobiota bacterium]